MMELDLEPASLHQHSFKGPASGALGLRICGGEYDGRIVRLVSRKCTIGSSRQCTLRLVARGVEPFHCLIVRGMHGMAIRRWSRETRLNGRMFLDSPLHVGDRVGIGSLELEVVEGSYPPTEPAVDAPPLGSTELDELRVRIAALHEQLVQQTQTLAEERSRNEDLASQSSRQAHQHEEAQQTIEQLRRLHDEANQRLANLQNEQTASLQQWQIERAELETQLDLLRNQAAEALSKLADQVAGEKAQAEETAKRRETWEATHAQLNSELAEVRQAWDNERLALQEQLRALREEHDAQTSLLHALQTQVSPAAPPAEPTVSAEVWENERRTFEEQLNTARQDAEWANQCAAQWEQIAASRIPQEDLARERQVWEEKLATLERQLTETQHERETEQAAWSVQSESLQAQVHALESQAADLNRQISEAVSPADVAAQREAWEAERRALEAQASQRDDLTAAGQRGDEQTALLESELQQTRQLLEETRRQLDHERLVLQQRSEEWEAALAEQHARASQLLTELETLQMQRAAESSQAVAELQEQTAQIETRQRELEQAQQVLAERHTQLDRQADETAQRAADCDARDAAIAQQTAELEQRAAVIQTRWAELNRKLEEQAANEAIPRQEEDALQALREQHEREIAQAKIEAYQQAAELEAQRRELEQLRFELDERRADLDRQAEQLAYRAAELEAQIAEIKPPSAAFESRDDHKADSLAPLNLASEPEFESGEAAPVGSSQSSFPAEWFREAAPLSDEPIVASESEYTPTLRLPRRDEAPLESLALESPSLAVSQPSAPVENSAAAILSRMGLTPNWDDEVEAPAEEVERTYVTPSAAAGAAMAAGNTPSPHAAEDEGESIEDYMARLLQRVRGENTGSTSHTAVSMTGSNLGATRPVNTVARTTTTQRATPRNEGAPDLRPGGSEKSLAAILGGPGYITPEEPAPIRPEEFVPRSQAPERTDRLAAMRDLANTSARSAIDRYTQTQWFTKAITKLAMAMGSVVAATLLGWMGSARPYLAYSVAFLLAAASIFWFVQAGRCFRQFSRCRRDKRRENAGRTTTPTTTAKAVVTPSRTPAEK